jgi:hypothetical protein
MTILQINKKYRYGSNQYIIKNKVENILNNAIFLHGSILPISKGKTDNI